MEVDVYKAWVAYLQLDLRKKTEQLKRLSGDYDLLVAMYENDVNEIRKENAYRKTEGFKWRNQEIQQLRSKGIIPPVFKAPNKNPGRKAAKVSSLPNVSDIRVGDIT